MYGRGNIKYKKNRCNIKKNHSLQTGSADKLAYKF